MKKSLVALVVLASFLLLCPPARAGAPMDTLRNNVTMVIEVLNDPKLKPASAAESKKERLRVIYGRMFDEVELAKRSLARHWNTMNAAQRQEFIPLFRQVLEKAYVDKILAYTNEKIVYDRESMVSESIAEIQTRIVTASKEIPIGYRLILKEGTWRCYDVVVENVSLVLNYRTQFNDILAKNKPEQLFEILRKKTKGQ